MAKATKKAAPKRKAAPTKKSSSANIPKNIPNETVYNNLPQAEKDRLNDQDDEEVQEPAELAEDNTAEESESGERA